MTAQRGDDTPDPLLVAEIEDIFDAVDPWSYLDPESAAAAYEQLVTGDWDGEE
jgi:hypothetical protein